MLFNLENLSNSEKELLLCMAVLPAGQYSVSELLELFQKDVDEVDDFFNLIYDLSTEGYLQKYKGNYFLEAANRRNVLEWKQPDFDSCSVIINSLSAVLARKRQSANFNHERVISLIESILNHIQRPSAHLAFLCHQLSNTYMKQDDYLKALKYSELSIKMAENIDPLHYSTATFYRDNAFINRKLGRNETALRSNKRDLIIFERSGVNGAGAISTYYSLSLTYKLLNNFNSAIKYSKRILNYEQGLKENDRIGLSWVYQNLSDCYLEMGDNKKGIFFIKKARNLFNPESKAESNKYKSLNKKFRFFSLYYVLDNLLHKYYFLLSLGLKALIAILLSVFLWWIFS